MKLYYKLALVLTFLVISVVGADAATNIYKDTYTTEDSTGNWTFTGTVTHSSSVTNSGTVTSNGQTILNGNFSIIAATPATLTTAQSNETFIIDGKAAGASATTIVSITLPAAATDLTYTFLSGDGSGIVIRTSDANHTALYTDTILYGLNGTATATSATNQSIRLTEKAAGATGASITVHGNSNGYWYLTSSLGSNAAVVKETRSTKF